MLTKSEIDHLEGVLAKEIKWRRVKALAETDEKKLSWYTEYISDLEDAYAVFKELAAEHQKLRTNTLHIDTLEKLQKVITLGAGTSSDGERRASMERAKELVEKILKNGGN